MNLSRQDAPGVAISPQADTGVGLPLAVDPVTAAVHVSQLELLGAESSTVDVEAALRRFRDRLLPLDGLQRELARSAAVRLLSDRRITDARRLVAIAVADLNGNGTAHQESTGQGQTVTLADPEPWPDSVDGVEVLDELAEAFSRHIALPEGGDTVLALWTLHAHAHAAAMISPLLALTSPERRCGKSTTLHLLSALAPRALPASSISPAALFRAVERYRPTFLLDEADTVFGPKGNEDLRCIVNASHARAGAVVIRTVGEDFEPRTFSSWCPKAVALIGDLPGPLADRAIVLRMRRRRPDEVVVKLRLDRLQQLEPVRRRAWRWAHDHLDELRRADPLVPEELHDRAADNWRPLLACADACGEGWPERARRAALTLSGVSAEDEGAPAVQLLADVRQLFHDRGMDRLSSGEIVEALVQREDRPWPEWHGKPLSKRGLARLLARFGISPTQLRIGGDKTRGYVQETFGDAFARYLPLHPVQAVQRSDRAENQPIGDPVLFDSVPDGELSRKPHGDSIVPDVPDGGGPSGKGDTWEPES